MDEIHASFLARAIVLWGLRNTGLEDIHRGIEPTSLTCDYSDVKVVTPLGEIPWNNLARISNSEMRALMKHAIDTVYTILFHSDEPDFIEPLIDPTSELTKNWDEPKERARWFGNTKWRELCKVLAASSKNDHTLVSPSPES
jgi:hypothetical protein